MPRSAASNGEIDQLSGKDEGRHDAHQWNLALAVLMAGPPDCDQDEQGADQPGHQRDWQTQEPIGDVEG